MNLADTIDGEYSEIKAAEEKTMQVDIKVIDILIGAAQEFLNSINSLLLTKESESFCKNIYALIEDIMKGNEYEKEDITNLCFHISKVSPVEKIYGGGLMYLGLFFSYLINKDFERYSSSTFSTNKEDTQKNKDNSRIDKENNKTKTENREYKIFSEFLPKITCLIGHQNNGGTISIIGDVCDNVGSHMQDGIIKIQGDAKNFLGEHMIGGKIIVTGNIEDACGYEMQNGEIIVAGNAGFETGSYMTSGTIRVGKKIAEVSHFIHGGEIYCEERRVYPK